MLDDVRIFRPDKTGELKHVETIPAVIVREKYWKARKKEIAQYIRPQKKGITYEL